MDYGLALASAVGLGVTCCPVVALLLPPATPYPSADEVVDRLAESVREVLAEMGDTLRESASDIGPDENWSRRTERLEANARRSRLTVEPSPVAATRARRPAWAGAKRRQRVSASTNPT